MSILAQGTQFFVIDPNLDSNGPGVLEIDCITAFNPGGNPSDQIEDTCLKYNSRTYKKGLRTPGQATGTLNADPENDSHYRFWQFAEDPEFDQIEMDMVIGWSDGPLD
ncbi:TPA: phage tail tube protein, partial [Pseudomonas aeruginosa]